MTFLIAIWTLLLAAIIGLIAIAIMLSPIIIPAVIIWAVMRNDSKRCGYRGIAS